MQRFEAVNRMLAHPMIGLDALGALRATVDDRGVQSLVGTACLFDGSAEPQAADEVVRHMSQPPDDRVYKGALMACVRKLRYGQFTGTQLGMLSNLIAEVLLDQGHLDDETGALAVSVMRQLPAQAHAGLGSRMLRRIARDGMHVSVIAENRLVGGKAGRVMAERIANYASARTPTAWDGYIDDVLPVLIDEMLFDPVFDARLYAACLIHSSPYRATVAEALGLELTSARWSGNLAWVTAVFEALRKLGGQAERAKVERFVTGRGVPGAVADAAAYALGHIGGASSSRFWREAFGLHLQQWVRSASPVSESILDRLVYAAGISEDTAVLQEIRADHCVPSQTRACASWWLGQPEKIRRSART